MGASRYRVRVLPLDFGTPAAQNAGLVKVGFAAETHDVAASAQRKLVQKGLDMIVANDVTQEGAGFAHDTNIVTLIDRSERLETLPLMSKDEVAHTVYDRLLALKNSAALSGQQEKN